MKRRIVLRRETLRTLTGFELRGARGAMINLSGLTGCSPCYPSDGTAGHCDSEACSGGASCDPATCTISLSG